MEYIDKNEGLLNFLTNDFSLIDSKINRINIYKSSHQLNIDVDIELMYSKLDKHLTLMFENVSEYSMYHTADYFFYNVEGYKFLKSYKGYYISFDPYTELSEISPEDQDYILSAEVKGYFSNT